MVASGRPRSRTRAPAAEAGTGPAEAGLYDGAGAKRSGRVRLEADHKRETMRAILVRQHGGPEVLKLEEVADPQPRDGEVLVRVRAAGVNPVDGYIRSGAHARKAVPPYVPGLDGAGEVVAAGRGVNRFAAGDRVYFGGDGGKPAGAGTYAELAVAGPAHLHPLPDGISFAQGAALGVPYATAYRALFQRGGARPSETVFVHGATGGVGIAAVQFARAHAMTIWRRSTRRSSPGSGTVRSNRWSAARCRWVRPRVRMRRSWNPAHEARSCWSRTDKIAVCMSD